MKNLTVEKPQISDNEEEEKERVSSSSSENEEMDYSSENVKKDSSSDNTEINLELFWKLGKSGSGEKFKLESAIKVLKSVLGSSEETVEYSLTRLINGLAGSDSRQGFYIALSSLLTLEPSHLPFFLTLVQKLLIDDAKGLSKSETGEIAVARMLAYGAALRASIHSPQIARDLIKKILENSSKRSYLKSASVKFVVNYLENYKEFNDDFLSSMESTLLDKTCLSSAWLLLFLAQKWPEKFGNEFAVSKLERPRIMGKEFLDIISNILSECSIPSHVLAIDPALVYTIERITSEGLFHEFWIKNLGPFLLKGTDYKTTLAFFMLKIALPILPDKSKVGALFTPMMVKASISKLSKLENSSQEDRALLQVFETVVVLSSEYKEVSESIITTLISGSIEFDRITGSTIIASLTRNLSASGVKKLARTYENYLLGLSDKTPPTMKERIYAGQQLAKLSSHPAMSGDRVWKSNLLQILATLTLFDVNESVGVIKSLHSPLNKESKIEIKSAFFKALDMKEKNFECLCLILTDLAKYIESLLKQGVKPSPTVDGIVGAWGSVMDIVKGAKSDKKGEVFKLLFIHVGIQLFCDFPMALEVLQDLKVCYSKSNAKGPSKRKSDIQDPEWIEVVVDLLLSLLSQNKNVLRQVVSLVFSILIPYINPAALGTIIDVIDPQEDEEDVEDEEDEGSDDEEEEEESTEEEDENEEETLNLDMKNKLKSALSDLADGNVSDAASVDMDDMDENSMKRMDNMLSDVFKTLSKKKTIKKSEKKALIAGIHFKTRVLDMIDIYINHSPPASHVLLLIPRLLDAMDKASKSKEGIPLEARIKSTLKKLANIKKPNIDGDMTPDLILSTLSKLIDLANTGSQLLPKLNQAIPLFSQICNFILKSSLSLKNSKLEDDIYGLYDCALDNFFDNNLCLLPPTFFQLAIQSNWPKIWGFVPKLISKGVGSKAKQFRKTQTVSLFHVLLKTSSQLESRNESELKEFLDSVVKSLCKSLNSSNDLHPRYFGEILRVLTCIYCQEKLKKLVEWSSISNALAALREKVPCSRKFIEIKKLYNRFASMLQLKVITNSDKKKFKKASAGVLINPNLKEAGKKKKKKKKGISNESAQKRKEKKTYELAGQFEGLEVPSFKGLALNHNLNFEKSNSTVNLDEVENHKSLINKPNKKRKRLSSTNNDEFVKSTKKIKSA